MWDGFAESNVCFKVLWRLNAVHTGGGKISVQLGLRHVNTTFLCCLTNEYDIIVASRANDLLMGLDFSRI